MGFNKHAAIERLTMQSRAATRSQEHRCRIVEEAANEYKTAQREKATIAGEVPAGMVELGISVNTSVVLSQRRCTRLFAASGQLCQ